MFWTTVAVDSSSYSISNPDDDSPFLAIALSVEPVDWECWIAEAEFEAPGVEDKFLKSNS